MGAKARESESKTKISFEHGKRSEREIRRDKGGNKGNIEEERTMSEERKFVYMRKTRSGKGVRIRDEEIVYIASIRSIERFIQGEAEYVAFAKMPYRQIPNEENARNLIYTWCDKCGGLRFFRKISEDKWKCEMCGTERTATELIEQMRSILECD